MFEASSHARLFAMPPGVDFPTSLAQGLRERMGAQPPEAMARVEVIVNTARMQTRLREALIQSGPGFLPRIRLISDLAEDNATSTLKTRLELAQTIRSFLRAEPYLGPQSAAFSLAESLFRLLDEMQGEGVSIEKLAELDVSQHSEHWDRSLRFIRLVSEYLDTAPGGQALLRRAAGQLAQRWATQPADHPVILAGSTGSRGPASMLMQAIARLPLGAVVVPGFDFDLPKSVWRSINDALQGQDHPQSRFADLMENLELEPDQVKRWTQQPAASPARNRLVSLALRPAPVTDQWLRDGHKLGDLETATKSMSLIEAQSPSHEALAIALCLRQAAVEGRRAALITPDRTLARRVTAALDRWHLRPDDSAGRPLSLSAPGRFLRQVAQLMMGETTAQGLIALLKHPLTHSAMDRGAHLLHLRELELYLRRKAIPFPDANALNDWKQKREERSPWADWLLSVIDVGAENIDRPLSEWIALHLELSERLACGMSGDGTGELWKDVAGDAARKVMDELLAASPAGGELGIHDYFALLETIFAGHEVREIVESHPDIMIWGTLEARAQWADLVVLGGLNDGIWPSSASPDPWFNRAMRHEAGLLLPERQIGLSAHDFQMALAAPEVVLSHARRDAEAETIPSRWLNRLLNLVSGLPEQNGPHALLQMKERGARWTDQADAFEAELSHIPAEFANRNPRPAPAPPVEARPRELAVTGIERLIRDPYEIYARYVLGLRELDPLSPEPDPLLRGTILHKVLEHYVKAHPPGSPGDEDAIFAIADKVLRDLCPWDVTRRQWISRLKRTAADFVAWNAKSDGTPLLVEKQGEWQMEAPLFSLKGKPDRIDIGPDGRLRVYDYKTGTPPSKKEQAFFNKQLILLSIMAEDGVFPGVEPRQVETAEFIGLGSKFETREADIEPESLAEHRAGLQRLIARYFRLDQGFTAMRAVRKEGDFGPYHALARRGEWEPVDPAVTLKVGGGDDA